MPHAGGRPKGSLNKATAELKVAAAIYTTEMLLVLVNIAKHGESDAARVAAANSILDRGHGKPAQTVDMNVNTKPIMEWDEAEIDRRIALALAGEETASIHSSVTH